MTKAAKWALGLFVGTIVVASVSMVVWVVLVTMLMWVVDVVTLGH